MAVTTCYRSWAQLNYDAIHDDLLQLDGNFGYPVLLEKIARAIQANELYIIRFSVPRSECGRKQMTESSNKQMNAENSNYFQ